MTHPVTENSTYTFTIDTTKPVIAKGADMHAYTYICEYDCDCEAKMQVLLRHDSVTGQPNLVDTITIDDIDYIPIVCKLSRKVSAAPNKVFFTPRGNGISAFHVYDVDIQ